MRPINLVIVHCSASDNPNDDSVERIRLLHTGNRKTPISWGKYQTFCNGWADIGYHYLITKDGSVHVCRPLEKAGAHCKGYNKTSIGVCLSGDKDFTEAQFSSLRQVAKELMENFGISILDIVPHKMFNKNKTCPNFDLGTILRGDYAKDAL